MLVPSLGSMVADHRALFLARSLFLVRVLQWQRIVTKASVRPLRAKKQQRTWRYLL